MRRLAVLVLTMLWAATQPAAWAAEPSLAQQFPQVADSSFTTARGDRTMRLSVVIKADPTAIWHALSTAEGWTGWAVKTAYVDFREGGIIETSYRPGVARGDPDNIQNQIIAFVPERLLVFRNVQAPRDFKDAETFGRIVTSIALEPLADGATRVTISGAGYGQGEAFDRLYGQFAWGNSYSLVELKKALEAAG